MQKEMEHQNHMCTIMDNLVKITYEESKTTYKLMSMTHIHVKFIRKQQTKLQNFNVSLHHGQSEIIGLYDRVQRELELLHLQIRSLILSLKTSIQFIEGQKTYIQTIQDGLISKENSLITISHHVQTLSNSLEKTCRNEVQIPSVAFDYVNAYIKDKCIT
jgi:hypothetical protein